MICLNCDNEQFTPGEAEVKQEFRGETLHVRTPVMLCQNCGWHTVGNDQVAELRRRTADAYRKKHNLLTSAQIKAMREALGMTQVQFATFLPAGVASVKRWESWLVQDASSNELIRVKCILAKKAETIQRVTNLLLQHAATATDWQQAVKQAQPLLANLGHYIQIAQPGTQPKIQIKLNVHTHLVKWSHYAQTTAAPSNAPQTFTVAQLQPTGTQPESLTQCTHRSDATALRFGRHAPASANRLATHPQMGETTDDTTLAVAA